MTVTYDQLADYWGSEGIVRYSDHDLHRLLGDHFRPEFRELVTIGLPRAAGVFFGAYSPAQAHLSNNRARLSLSIGRAWHGVCEIEVDMGDLDVWSIVSTGQSSVEITFVNSGICQFVEFLYRMSIMAEIVGMSSREDFLGRAEVEKRMLSLSDPAATEEGSWWFGIIEEMTTMV